MENETKRLTLNPAEAAEKLGVSLPTLRSEIKKGTIPSIRLGTRRVLIPVSALEKYLESAGSKA